ncbi:MAG: hypothetical protein MRQ09_06780 [Candidatus Midichloria sp.]|nr:hypothetical protein [Candidatus Midichloria sp.]
MIETNDQALWSLLLYAGYLKVLSTEIDHLGQLRAQIAIPNKEVSFVYYSIVRDWLTIPSRQKSYDVFINSFIKGDMGQLKALLSTYIIQAGSYFDFNQNIPLSKYSICLF